MKLQLLSLALALAIAFAFAADKDKEKEKPKPGSISFGAKTKLDGDLVKARQTSQAFVQVAKAVKPCVVSVSSTKILKAPNMGQFPGGSPFDFFFGPGMPRGPEQQLPKEKEYRQEGLGSGVIVSADGYILTNNHVVEGADEISVAITEGKEVEAEIVGTDKESDIAVLKLKEKVSNLAVASLGNSDDLEIGEWVLAVGNPFSKKLSHTVTAGIVSAKGRSTGINKYENFIQTDASINPGNSGGALVNLAGEVIGINTAIMSTSGGNVGIGFAIPMNMAKKVMEDLVYRGKVSRGWLGIQMQPLEKNLADALGLKDNNGVLINSVLKDTPADKAGLKAEDVILALDDELISNQEQLQNLIGNLPPGTKLKVKVFRDKKEKTIEVTLAERTSALTGETSKSSEDLIGLSVRDVTPELAQRYELETSEKGALVASVRPSSPASAAGLQEGDLVKKVGGKELNSVADYNNATSSVAAGQTMLFLVKRGKSTLFLGLKIKEEEKK